ncbi:MAG: hypothetical protein P1V97_13740 [Planctomycetota bacterium]|nr:hypothetical protein [Planctomycetota bacterium]
MALDPKQVLLENKALTICYVLALAAIIVQFTVVGPLGSGKETDRKNKRLIKQGKGKYYQDVVSEVKRIDRNLNTLVGRVNKADLLTTADKVVWDEHKKNLTKNLEGLAVPYQKRDEYLERWFEGLDFKKMGSKDGTGSEPDAGGFEEEYKSRFTKLQKSFQDLASTEGGSILQPAAKTGSTPKKMMETQKIFWFKLSLLEAMKEGKVVKLVSKILVSPKQNKIAEAKGYKVFDCRFTVKTQFRNIPLLVKAILASKLTFKVTGVEIRRPDFKLIQTKPSNLSVNGTAERKFFDKGVYKASFPEGTTEFKGSEEELIPEPTVFVEIFAQGLDFLPIKKKAPAPAE